MAGNSLVYLSLRATEHLTYRRAQDDRDPNLFCSYTGCVNKFSL